MILKMAFLAWHICSKRFSGIEGRRGEGGVKETSAAIMRSRCWDTTIKSKRNASTYTNANHTDRILVLSFHTHVAES